MPDEAQLFVDVERAILTVLKPNGTPISAETTLIGDLGAESIDFLDLSCELERLVEVEIDFEELFEARRKAEQGRAPDLTVRDLVSYLQSRGGRGAELRT
jgi:acyl carrier protein